MAVAASVIVLNHNGASYLPDALGSLCAQTFPDLDVIVADNGSTDESRAVAGRFPVRWVPLGRNHGFAAGNNLAARETDAHVLVFVNNDMRFAPDFVEHLATPLLDDVSLFATDATQLSWDGERVLHARSVLTRPPLWRSGDALLPGVGIEQRAAAGHCPVVQACGGNMAVRRDRFCDLGGFDGRYPAGWEDLDICWRAWLRGWRTLYVPEARCWHHVGGTSTTGDGARVRLHGTIAGRVLFATKHLPARHGAMTWLAALARLAAHAATGHPSTAREHAAALRPIAASLPTILRDRRTTYRSAHTTPARHLTRMQTTGPTRERESQTRPIRVALVVSHPIQYLAPLHRTYAAADGLSPTVVFESLRGALRTHDKDFGLEIAWDRPLLDGYDWVALSASRSTSRLRRGLKAIRIFPALLRLRPEIVVTYGYASAASVLAFAIARFALDVPILLLTDAHRVIHPDTPLARRLVKPPTLRCIYRSFTGVLATSSRGVSLARRLRGGDDGVHRVIHTVDLEPFLTVERDKSRARWRKDLHIDPAAFVVVYSGKLVPWKRVQDVIAAVAMLRDAHLLIVGDGPEREALERMARECDVADRTHFLGFRNQTELPDVYASADVLVLPSEREAFGLVLVEALALGLPIVASNACGACDDLIDVGRTGYTYDVGDIEQLRLVLEELRGTSNHATTPWARDRALELGPARNCAEMHAALAGTLSRSLATHRAGVR